ncbi:MAG: pyridoxal phosphate-dependent aminotransferase [Gammaproteobacteria bacterium]
MNKHKGPLAGRMAHIQPFHVMALLARARELEAAGRSIVHMEIGEPDFTTPAPVIEAGRRALSEGRTHYTPATGLASLREAIAGHYRNFYGVAVAPQRIVVTPGASGALLLVLAAVVDPGQQVLMADPGYPCNRNFVRVVGGEPIAVPVGAACGFQPTVDQVGDYWSKNAVALMLASPANPTGMLLARSHLEQLQDFVWDRGGCLIMDEIYHGLTYGDQVATALSVSNDLFVINSFSKYFGMTGWRLGWLVAPEAYQQEMEKLAQNLFLAAPTPAQYAALAAFEPATAEILEQRRVDFQGRRDYLLPELRKLGFSLPVTPQGAFYLYADCKGLTDDSFKFSERLLEQAGVAVTPGSDFGVHKASRYLRFAYTTSLENLKEGVQRLRKYLQD